VVPRNPLVAICIGALLGLVFPMCECGIIVVMKRLLRKGLPLSVCVAYMLAGPVINIVVMGSTYVAFSSYNVPGRNDVLGGPEFVVGWRVGLSYLVAVVTALIVHWQWNIHGNRLLHPSVLHGLRTAGANDDASVEKRTIVDRINNITQTALHDFVDIMAFLVLGSVLAAGGKFIITESNVQEMIRANAAVAILLMMGIAILFCLCSEADAFVAANFPLFWPDGSKLAFLVLGPMLDLKLLLMFTRVYRLRLIYTIVISLVVQVFIYTMIVGAIFGRTHPPEATGAEYKCPNCGEIHDPAISPSVETYLLGIGMGPDPMSQLLHFDMAFLPTGEGERFSYKYIYDLAASAEERRNWRKDRAVEVRGQFEAVPGNDQAFFLSRLQITCCSSDATKMRMPVFTRQSVAGFSTRQWVQVTGHVEFREMGGKFVSVLVVSRVNAADPKASDIVPCNPDPDPYVQ
jgi:uncharacterized membrane protein YraQ (UPF0718 family)